MILLSVWCEGFVALLCGLPPTFTLLASIGALGSINCPAATPSTGVPYAGFSSTRTLCTSVALGMDSSSTPSLRLAVTFDVSTSAGKSTARKIWFRL